MEVKVKQKSMDSIETKEEDGMKKTKEYCVVIGQEREEGIFKGQETMKIFDSFRQNQDEKHKKTENNNHCYMKNKKTSSHVWDCGSTLYDSFELNSFKRQLDSAISASSGRTMSMSHLPDRRLSQDNPPPPEMSPSSGGKKHSNKISRSIQRLLKSVFRPKQSQSLSSSTSSPVYNYKAGHGGGKDGHYVVSGSLTTIPESTEKEMSPEINSLVRKTVSERIPANRVVVGLSCA